MHASITQIFLEFLDQRLIWGLVETSRLQNMNEKQHAALELSLKLF